MDKLVRTSYKIILQIILAGGLLGFFINRIFRSFGTIKQLSNIAIDVTILLFAIAIFVLAGRVRKYLNGKNPNLSGIKAAKIFTLCKTAIMVASILLGFYVGNIIAIFDIIQYSFATNYLINCGITIVCSGFLLVAGIIGEGMCQIPPNKMDEEME